MNNARTIEGKAISVCGLISSGKSSIIQALSFEFNWDIISFGDYVKSVAQTRSLEINRSSLQELGEELVASTDPEVFIRKVIEYNVPKTNIHLYDGVRHLKIIDAIQHIYLDSFIVPEFLT